MKWGQITIRGSILWNVCTVVIITKQTVLIFGKENALGAKEENRN